MSTGTKTLQDQLFERDLPLMRDALATPVTVALLKGRANYVCHHHLERTAREGRLPTRDDARYLPKIVAFARATERGDRAELADVPENAAIWPLVTSTRDNCLGSNCAFHRECFVMKARKEALDADVVVINHHLFFADVTLRDEGLAELLPACNTVILDEAHQLPDTATLFFGEQTTAGAAGRARPRRRSDRPHAVARRARSTRCERRARAVDPQVPARRRRHARQVRAAGARGTARVSRRARSARGGTRSAGERDATRRRSQRGCRRRRAARRSGRRRPRALAGRAAVAQTTHPTTGSAGWT